MKIFLGYPNRIDAATLSGGSWETLLPLANIKTRELEAVARSTDLANASTRMQIDLGAVRSLRAVTLHNHNLSQTARWRVKLGTTAGASDIYSGAYQAAWLLNFDDPHTPWESGAWWTEPDGDYRRHPYMAPILLPQEYAARYLTIEIDDPDNTDGYVQIGRVFVGTGLMPVMYQSGAPSDAWEDLSTVTHADGGGDFIYRRRRRRVSSFGLDNLSLTTDFHRFHEFLRRVGVVEEVLYLTSVTDYQQAQRTGMLGMLTELSPIEYPYARARSVQMRIRERL